MSTRGSQLEPGRIITCGTANDTPQGPGSPGWEGQERGGVGLSGQANPKTVDGDFEQKYVLRIGPGFRCHYLQVVLSRNIV